MARSFENRLSTERGLQAIVAPTCASLASCRPVHNREFKQDPAPQAFTARLILGLSTGKVKWLTFSWKSLEICNLCPKCGSLLPAAHRTVRMGIGLGCSISARATPFFPLPFTRYIA